MLENNLIPTLLIWIILGSLGGFLIAKVMFLSHRRVERRSAVTTSRSVILGEVYEKVLPALPSFPYAPKDMVFIGKWVDYVIFDGLSEGTLREIVFLELKSGSSRLNANEKLIKECLSHKKVRFSEYRVGSYRKE